MEAFFGADSCRCLTATARTGKTARTGLTAHKPRTEREREGLSQQFLHLGLVPTLRTF